MSEEIKRPLNADELTTLDKAMHALVRARPILASRYHNMQCVSDVIVMFWALNDDAHKTEKLT
jgi:hypothetical protein